MINYFLITIFAVSKTNTTIKNMKRRDFYKIAIGTAASLPLMAMTPPPKDAICKKFPRKIIKPSRLKIGATIGLIAPSSPIPLNRFQQTIKNLEGMGFQLVYNEKNVLATKGYLAGSDELRAAEVNRMFADKNIDGIWCVRGGYGSARILPMLDYKMIKKNPKVIIGYSDVTALLHGIFLKTGLVGFHGPVGASTFTDYTTRHVTSLLMSPKKEYEIDYAKENLGEDDPIFKPYAISKGIAKGKIVGGNLTLVSSLMGTPYELEMKDKLVFLEDIGEKPYRIDRMITQLLLAGGLKEAAGIVLGVFSDCEAKPNDTSLSLKETMMDRFKNLGIPVVYGLSFGHISNNFTFPIGIEATMNTENFSITLNERAVK